MRARLRLREKGATRCVFAFAQKVISPLASVSLFPRCALLPLAAAHTQQGVRAARLCLLVGEGRRSFQEVTLEENGETDNCSGFSFPPSLIFSSSIRPRLFSPSPFLARPWKRGERKGARTYVVYVWLHMYALSTNSRFPDNFHSQSHAIAASKFIPRDCVPLTGKEDMASN